MEYTKEQWLERLQKEEKEGYAPRELIEKIRGNLDAIMAYKAIIVSHEKSHYSVPDDFSWTPGSHSLIQGFSPDGYRETTSNLYFLVKEVEVMIDFFERIAQGKHIKRKRTAIYCGSYVYKDEIHNSILVDVFRDGEDFYLRDNIDYKPFSQDTKYWDKYYDLDLTRFNIETGEIDNEMEAINSMCLCLKEGDKEFFVKTVKKLQWSFDCSFKMAVQLIKKAGQVTMANMIADLNQLSTPMIKKYASKKMGYLKHKYGRPIVMIEEAIVFTLIERGEYPKEATESDFCSLFGISMSDGYYGEEE